MSFVWMCLVYLKMLHMCCTQSSTILPIILYAFSKTNLQSWYFGSGHGSEQEGRKRLYKQEYQMAGSLLIQTGADRKTSIPTKKAGLPLTGCDNPASVYSPLSCRSHTRLNREIVHSCLYDNQEEDDPARIFSEASRLRRFKRADGRR